MNFLLPQVLWALPALSLPLIIHLLSRANTRLVDFSTLFFLRRMQHESIRRLRWHQWLLVLLRTLLLLVLILLLARPVVRGYFQGTLGAGASTFSITLIDDSFSMNRVVHGLGVQTSDAVATRLGLLTALQQLLAEQGGQSRAVMVRTSDARVIYDGPVADLPGPEDLVRLAPTGFQRDRLNAVLDTIGGTDLQSAARLFANREVFILSDFQTHQQSALRRFRQDTTLWDGWHFFLLPAARLEDNTAVIQAGVDTPVPLAGELMDVTATLMNTGRSPQRKVPAQVVLNGVRSGQLVVDLRPGERKTVQFQVMPAAPGHQEGYIEVERDERPGDNRYYFHTYIPEKIRVVLVQEPSPQPTFLQVALGSLAAEVPQIRLMVVTPSDPAWSARETDVVILNRLEALPRLLLRQVQEFLDLGGNLFIVPASAAVGGQPLRTLGTELDLPPLSDTPRIFRASIPLDQAVVAASLLRDVFIPPPEGGDSVGVHQVYPVSLRGRDRIVLAAEGSTPLLIRTPTSNGHVFLFTLPFHLQWSNLPLLGGFIPLWHRLIYWRPQAATLDDVQVGEAPRVEIDPRLAARSHFLTAPGGIASLLIPDLRTRTVTLRDLNKPGIYTLRPAGAPSGGESSRQPEGTRFAVNIAPEELTHGQLSAADLRTLFGDGDVFILPAGGALEEWVRQARFGRELWRPLLYLLVILVILELVVSNVFHAPRISSREQ